jgi:Mannose-6-phosphate isomerase
MLQRVLDQLPILPVSHNPAVSKRVLFARGEAPNITQIARSTFPPGEIAPGHSHADMWEVFIFESGAGEIAIDGETHRVAGGAAFLVQPGETHEIRNTGSEPLVVTVIGIAEAR